MFESYHHTPILAIIRLWWWPSKPPTNYLPCLCAFIQP